MDVGTFTTLVSSVGFPIVAAGVLAFYVYYLNKKTSDDIRYLEEKHEKAEEKAITAINNNTVAVTKLCEKLDKGGD